MKRILLILVTVLFLTGCDSNDLVPTQPSQLLHTWKLVSFGNKSNNSIITETNFTNAKEITITFKDGNNFEGTTNTNNFWGTFSSDEKPNLLTLNGIVSTEVNEHGWGEMFYDSLQFGFIKQTSNYQYTYEIENDILKIHFTNQQFMTFEKL